MSQSPVLPIAWVSLRVLIVLNWLAGAAVLLFLGLTWVIEPWILTAFGIASSADTPALILGLRAIAVLGLVSIPLNYVILKRLAAMVLTVRRGDPFIANNARSLRTIAWTLLGLQIISLAIGAIGALISTTAHPLHLDAGFSPSGWLAVFLTFVLARVFAEGTLMREDLKGMV